LRPVVDETKDLKRRRNQNPNQARIADALWIYDEARARLMFEKAFHGIEDLKTKPVIRFEGRQLINDPKVSASGTRDDGGKTRPAFAKIFCYNSGLNRCEARLTKTSTKTAPRLRRETRSDRGQTLLIRLANTAIDVEQQKPRVT